MHLNTTNLQSRRFKQASRWNRLTIPACCYCANGPVIPVLPPDDESFFVFDL